jgi:hypothetical protein
MRERRHFRSHAGKRLVWGAGGHGGDRLKVNGAPGYWKLGRDLAENASITFENSPEWRVANVKIVPSAI